MIVGLFLCRGAGIRTRDLYVPNVARYQLRYTPSLVTPFMLSLISDKVHALSLETTPIIVSTQTNIRCCGTLTRSSGCACE
jgi:hypothetical protein